jgi:hypothetical protein
MIKIPENGKYGIPNNSDLFGNIWYTKNINLNEDGYIKLSSRAVSLFSELDVANLRLPVAFGRGNLFQSPDSIDFAITQAGQKGYWLTLLETGNTLNVDVGVGVATLSVDSHGAWFQNLWHITDPTELYTKAGLADSQTYTARSASLTTGKVHWLEVFKNRNTICVTNGNTIKQFDSSYAASIILTLPADFEAVAMSYSNNSMGIVTMFSDTTTGKNQNQEAYFFVWDGSSTSASSGIPVGSDKIISIVPYKGSWVILTREGQLRYYNGGGWQDLPALPFYYKDLIWGTSYTRDSYGDVMFVEGDLIYININGLFTANGSKYERVLTNNPGGIICYDPKIGIYQRYSPSISPANVITVTSANVNTSTNILTKTAGTLPSTGSPIKYIYDKSSLIGGLKTPVVYYCIQLSSTTFSLAETKEDALAGNAIDITSTGAANNYFLALEVYDYGQSFANTVGAITDTGTTDSQVDHLIFGSELNDYNSTGNSVHLNITSPDFPNRGYFVTPKILSSEVEDTAQKIFIKYRPLSATDKIILKYKNMDYVGLPVSTPQARTTAMNQCIWTGANSFYTTADLSDALTQFDNDVELECEIIAGAGAGSMTKITDITFGSGTYAVTLDEDIDGATSGRYCDIIIDSWNKIIEIDNTDPRNWREIILAEPSKWIKLKVELRGVETTIEEIQVINKTQIPSE